MSAARIAVSLERPSGDALDALLAIERAAFATPGLGLPDEVLRPWARIWVAREPGFDAPSGFLLAWDVADELHILTVATHPSRRRRGVGRALVAAAVASAQARRARHALLEVRRSNHDAIALYRAAGFHVLGVRVRYYADDEDALEMILRFDPETGEVVPGVDEARAGD